MASSFVLKQVKHMKRVIVVGHTIYGIIGKLIFLMMLVIMHRRLFWRSQTQVTVMWGRLHMNMRQSWLRLKFLQAWGFPYVARRYQPGVTKIQQLTYPGIYGQMAEALCLADWK